MSATPESLGEFEQLVLLAVMRTARSDAGAYGISVHDELVRHTGRRVGRGAIYMTLDRLEKKGLLDSYFTEPTAERGGRRRRCYRVTRRATAALEASRLTLRRLWAGLSFD